MKNIWIITSIFWLGACTSASKQSEADYYREIAKAETNQAIAHGNLPGTPENLEGIDKAQERSNSFHESARKKERSLFDIILDEILD